MPATGFTVAAAQYAPSYMDSSASAEKAVSIIADAGAKGADLVAFGESWLSGYPHFLHYPFDNALKWEMRTAYLMSAIDVPGPETEALCGAAREAGCAVVMGALERETRTGGTFYCTLVFIDGDGTLLGTHRKLVATDAERTAWSGGDAAGLHPYDMGFARVSGLMCWEHKMLLPTYVIASQGTDVHVASWPGGPGTQHAVLSRAAAMQLSTFVVDVGGVSVPDAYPRGWGARMEVEQGESRIFGPDGSALTEPVEGEALLLATTDAVESTFWRSMADVGGHYGRPDVFQVTVRRGRPTNPPLAAPDR